MNKKILPVAIIALLVLAIPVALAMDRKGVDVKEKFKRVSDADVEDELLRVRTALADELPETRDVVDKEIDSIPTTPNRFLLWTKDGTHVMWGKYANGYFKGEDNEDVQVWGIYGKNIFAGFYGEEFFFGKYRGKHWKAYGLFEENRTSGKFEVFPGKRVRPARLSSVATQ